MFTYSKQRQAKMPAAGATQALRLCLTVVGNKFTQRKENAAGNKNQSARGTRNING